MPRIIVEAIDANGDTTFVSVPAEGPAEAVRSVERDGLQVIGVREDRTLVGVEILRRADDRRRTSNAKPGELVALSQTENLALQMWAASRLIWRKGWWCVPLTGLVAWLDFLIFGHPLYSAMIAVGFLALPSLATLYVRRHGWHLAHASFEQALYEARWKDAWKDVDRLRSRYDPFVIAGMRAKVLAANGRVDEGVELIESFAGRVAEVAMHVRVGIARAMAKDYMGSEAAYERALAVQPDHPVVLASLAQFRIERHRDVDGARAYLDRVDPRALIRQAAYRLPFVEGLVALEQGEVTEARDLLEGAYGDLGQREPKSYFAMARDVTAMYLAEVHARLGDVETAHAYFAKASPSMERHERRDLLERVERALAAAAA